MSAEIFSPVTLPCSGRTMANRLTKVALNEHLSKWYGGPPNKYHMGLYSEWTKHDWGMIITGNFQVSPDHLTLGRDVVIPRVLNEETLAPFKALARTIHAEDACEGSKRTLAIIQLSHVGRQSPNFMGGRRFGVAPMAPSPIRLGSNKRVRSPDGMTFMDVQDTPHPYFRAMFQRPKEMTLHDIKQVQQAFVRGALTALQAGFDGIQLHCAHGYLLAQFLNPKSNVRRDEYSAEPQNALRMMRETVEGIRAVAPKDFIISVKINSADYVERDETPSDERVLREAQRVLDHVHSIASWEMVDVMEISGGDYESPDFMSAKTSTPRQAFFAQFAKKARECLKMNLPAGVNAPLILLTGGLRSPAHLQSALDAGHADLLGIGRGSILRPDLPVVLQERIRKAAASGALITSDEEPFSYEPEGDIQLPSWLPQIPLVGATAGVAWYTVRLRSIAASPLEKEALVSPTSHKMSGMEAIVRMWVWLEWPDIIRAVLPVVCSAAVLVYTLFSTV